MPKLTLADLAHALEADLVGDGAIEIIGAAEPQDAGPEHLAMAMAPAYAEKLEQGAARAALLWADADWEALGLQGAIRVGRPRMAMAGVTARLDPGPQIASGVHPAAVIDPTAEIGAGASIAPLVVVGPGARIGAGATIGPHVSIGAGTVIGDDALIHAGVKILHNVRIGDRFIAQPGAVIGGDGFSFVTPEESGVEQIRKTLGQRGEIRDQHWARIHSLGGVEIGDDVEVGSNACVDAGTIRATRIGDGTKLDNMVQVAHNVVIGRDCLLCGHSGAAGSATLGDRVVLGGQAGVSDNIFVGDDVIAGGGAKIMSNAPAGRVLLGYPATKMDSFLESSRALRRLPRTLKRLSAQGSGEKQVSNPDESD